MKTPEQWAAELWAIPGNSQHSSQIFPSDIAAIQSEAYAAGQAAAESRGRVAGLREAANYFDDGSFKPTVKTIADNESSKAFWEYGVVDCVDHLRNTASQLESAAKKD